MARFCKIYNLPVKVFHSPPIKWKLEAETQFLSGDRLAGLDRIMMTKRKSSNKKIFIEIGLHTLKLKEVKKGKTAKGAPKMTVTFSKPPKKYEIDGKQFTDTNGNNSDMSYCNIDCTHMLADKTRGEFSKMWFKPFSMSLFTEDDFKKLPQGAWLKCVVLHREERFTINGVQQTYKATRSFKHEYGDDEKIGKAIILIKPEVVSVYHIDTPDSEIEVNYFSLYKPLKK